MQKLLLFGNTGKMGTAVTTALGDAFDIIGLCSKDVDIADLDAAADLVTEVAPDVVVNAAAFLGIDACENNPSQAFLTNALFPRRLARLAREGDFTLVHFSTDAVFSGRAGRALTEDDEPDPVNVYGSTKYSADVLIRDAAPKHYVFRLPVLFGENPKRSQLVEKLIDKVRGGETTLRVADDVVSNPSYSLDIARTLAQALDEGWDHGLYHVANEGQASLYDLISAVMDGLGIEVAVERASCNDFPSVGAKNLFTPIRSTKIPPMRPWQEALGEYLSGQP